MAFTPNTELENAMERLMAMMEVRVTSPPPPPPPPPVPKPEPSPPYQLPVLDIPPPPVPDVVITTPFDPITRAVGNEPNMWDPPPVPVAPAQTQAATTQAPAWFAPVALAAAVGLFLLFSE